MGQGVQNEGRRKEKNSEKDVLFKTKNKKKWKENEKEKESLCTFRAPPPPGKLLICDSKNTLTKLRG